MLTDNRICVAFGDDDVDHTVDAARRAFAAVAWIGVVGGVFRVRPGEFTGSKQR